VEDKMKELFPNPNGVEYIGFQSADANDNDGNVTLL
jgi:hypothetical protein